MKPSPGLKHAILQMYAAYSAADATAVMAFISGQPGVIAIGTDPAEWWDDYEELRRATEALFAEMGGAAIVTGNLEAFEEGTVGWAADNARIRLPNGREIPFRFTVVCRLEEGAWRIVQQHSSIGVANAELFG